MSTYTSKGPPSGAAQMLASRTAAQQPGQSEVPVNVAVSYLDRGFSIVPQLPGAKSPCVKWKEFQDRRPTKDEVLGWWTRWPEAGIAIILGEISGLFAIDVDGEGATRCSFRSSGASQWLRRSSRVAENRTDTTSTSNTRRGWRARRKPPPGTQS